MEEELKKVKSKSFISAVSLVGNSTYSALLGFTAFFILTLKSGAYLLGIYNTVLAALSIFNYFTNLGLAAAIMQKNQVKQIDLNTAFYIQLLLTGVAVIVGIIFTKQVFVFYKDLPSEAIYLYWATLASFFLLSLKTIPSVLLEKKIEIYKVVSVQVLENTAFYVTIIGLLIMGYSIFAIVAGVLVRSVIGLVAMYIINPWFPTFSFSFKSAKRLLSYGIPFQSNSLLSLVKDDLLVLYLGGAIGLSNLGLVMFGKKYAEFSIRIIMDNINRVAFPLFAKYQDAKDILKKSLQKVFFFESLLIFPVIVGAMFVFDILLKIVPGYFDKWQIAIFSFYVFSLYAVLVTIYSPLISFFNAIGRVKTSLFYMVVFTILQWVFVVGGMKYYGFNGISIGFLLMSFSGIFVVRHAKKYLEFSVLSFIKESIIAAGVMGLYLAAVRLLLNAGYINDVYYLVGAIAGGGVIYFMAIYCLKGKRFVEELIDLTKLKLN